MLQQIKCIWERERERERARKTEIYCKSQIFPTNRNNKKTTNMTKENISEKQQHRACKKAKKATFKTCLWSADRSVHSE